MTKTTDRATGAFFLAFGALLYFVVIPAQIDGGSGSSWVLPATIPNAVSMIIAVCGFLLILKPTNQRGHNTQDLIFAVIYLVLLAFGLFVMSYVGFLYTAPFIALIIMLLIGERRPAWLAIGVIGLPVIIWVLVAQILERPLP
jgi:putative tricarboxylic transport membrane protein